MLHSCDVENYEDMSATMVEKGEIKKKGRTYCVAGEPNDISYKNNTHIPGSSIHYFSKNVAVWPKWTRCDRRAFALQCRRLHTGFEGACYEHISLVKSGENYQWIQLKKMLIRGSVPTPNTNVQDSFRLTFCKRRMVSSLLLFISRTWDVLSFQMTTFALFLSYENPTNCNFHRILTKEKHHF